MSTDIEWVKWGQQDPYYAVITDERFRAVKLTDDAKQSFFDSGRWHASYVLDTCRRLIDPTFEPARALDFGCGVGRVSVPFAERMAAVVGVDVSPDMLAEARRNCDLHGLTNVELLPSDDTLSAVTGSFDLVHSCITFQHIDVPRGRRLFARLIELLADDGIGAIQITYGKAYHPDNFGQPPATAAAPVSTSKIEGLAPALMRAVLGDRRAPVSDPEMQMNPYNLSELAFMLQTAGVKSFSVDFTDHGGELGVFLFFRKPARGMP